MVACTAFIKFISYSYCTLEGLPTPISVSGFPFRLGAAPRAASNVGLKALPLGFRLFFHMFLLSTYIRRTVNKRSIHWLLFWGNICSPSFTEKYRAKSKPEQIFTYVKQTFKYIFSYIPLL